MISLIALCVFGLGVAFGVFDRLERWFVQRSAVAGNVFAVLIILSGVFAVFAVRRMQQAEREAALREEAERRFRTIVERVPAVVYTWDAADAPGSVPVTYISPQIETLLGYTADEWIGDPTLWSQCAHPDDQGPMLESWADAASRAAPFTGEYRVRRADGHLIWVREEAVPVAVGPRGRPIYQGVLLDITEQKRAEESYRQLVERLPTAVYVDTVGDVPGTTYVSPQYEALTGYPAEERLREPDLWERMIHPDDRDRVVSERRRTRETGDPFDLEYRIVRKDGRTAWIHVVASLVDDDERPAWQGLVTDISERKMAEEALARRDRILEAVGRAAERFLGVSSWTEVMAEVLARLGVAGGASRAAIYRNATDEDGRLCVTLVREWAAPGVKPLADEIGERLFPFDEIGLSRWPALLEAGEPIQGLTAQLPEPERAILGRAGVRAIVVMPIVVAGSWWGHLAYDQVEEDRVWQKAELDALRVVANILGAAIGREQAARKLSETEARYRSLIETVPAATYIDTVDAVSKAIYMSPQVEDIFGYTPEEWVREPELWERGVHPDDLPEVVARIERLNADGVPYEAEYRFRRPDGRVVWVHDQAVVIRDEHGRPIFCQGVMFDITERREAEEQIREAEERFRAIVEHVPAAIYLDAPDESLRTLYMSPQVEEMTGVSADEWMANPEAWKEALLPEDRHEVLRSYLAAVKAGVPWSSEYRMRTRDGRTIWVRDETVPLHDEEGNRTVMQGVIFDITELKVAEEALRASEQRERDAAERLRALDEMKNTFLAAVSHELRSPLTSILGLALTLERSEMDADDRNDLLERLAANARKLDRLLKDLLDIDRLNRGIVEPQYRPTDVGALARRTIESLESLADRSIVVLADPVVLSVDPAKVERIVENLLMNAARHTTPDRTIWLQVREGEGGVLICVEDDGAGVDEELREAIFEPFRQGPTASPHAPGTGIGLTLVGRFAALHGGRAWVEEREGGGASFRVFLPAGPSPDPQPSTNGGPPGARHGEATADDRAEAG